MKDTDSVKLDSIRAQMVAKYGNDTQTQKKINSVLN